jgi:hypothetical protein
MVTLKLLRVLAYHGYPIKVDSFFILGEFKLPKLAVSFGSKIIVFDFYYSQDVLQSEISMTIHKELKISETIVFMEWITETVIFLFNCSSYSVSQINQRRC